MGETYHIPLTSTLSQTNSSCPIQYTNSGDYPLFDSAIILTAPAGNYHEPVIQISYFDYSLELSRVYHM